MPTFKLFSSFAQLVSLVAALALLGLASCRAPATVYGVGVPVEGIAREPGVQVPSDPLVRGERL